MNSRKIIYLLLIGLVAFSCTYSNTGKNGSVAAESLDSEKTTLPDVVDLTQYQTTYLYGTNFHGIFEYRLIGDSATEPFQYIEIETKIENSVRTSSFSMYDYYLTVSNSYKEVVRNNIAQITNYIIFEPGADGIPKPAIADSLIAPAYNLHFPIKDTFLISFRFDSPSQPDFYVVFKDKNWINWVEKASWKNKEVSMLVMNGNFKFSYKQKNFTYNNEMECKKTYYYAKGIGLVRYSFKCNDGRNNTYELNRIISPSEFREMQLNPPKPPVPVEDTSPAEMFVPISK